jgi:hypothetical protein
MFVYRNCLEIFDELYKALNYVNNMKEFEINDKKYQVTHRESLNKYNREYHAKLKLNKDSVQYQKIGRAHV